MLSVPSPFIVIAPDAGAVPVARPRAEPSAAVVVFNVTFVPITALPVPPLASSLPITEIAMACGFQTTSHFSRVFRAHFGTSPVQKRDTRG